MVVAWAGRSLKVETLDVVSYALVQGRRSRCGRCGGRRTNNMLSLASKLLNLAVSSQGCTRNDLRRSKIQNFSYSPQLLSVMECTFSVILAVALMISRILMNYASNCAKSLHTHTLAQAHPPISCISTIVSLSTYLAPTPVQLRSKPWALGMYPHCCLLMLIYLNSRSWRSCECRNKCLSYL